MENQDQQTDSEPKKNSNLMRYIDAILLIILIVIVIGAWVDGTYIRKEIQVIETCQGQPTSEIGKEILSRINLTTGEPIQVTKVE